MRLNRREVLRHTLSLASTVYVSTALTGCVSSGALASLDEADFTHGVASGDPEPDALMLWTRAVPRAGERVQIAWEVAEDANFERTLRSGITTTSSDRDYTIKVDVRDLVQGRDYYYRFRSADGVSTTGKARTPPTDAIDELHLAVFSCSNYPAGYFHAYAEAAGLSHIDAFLHLGDYFYEYGVGGYATERAEELGRSLASNNSGELLTLEDYRRRYALYRSDKDLQALHAAAPMIAVWDDHEIANDTWKRGAENHSNEEGDFEQRRTAAIQAYFEWMPLRPVIPDAEGRIYRSFAFGDLVDLHMLDTRLVGRDRQLNYRDFVDRETGILDNETFLSELSSPTRSLLGEPQRDWLYGSLQASSAKWQVLGQQVLMARMTMPTTLLEKLFQDRDFNRTRPTIERLVRAKAAMLQGADLSPQAAASVKQVLPYNLDAWDGYPAEREQLYAVARRLKKSLVVLAGDTHNAWYSELRDRWGQPVGVELGASSVSSPGMESYLGLANEDQSETLARALTTLIDELQYCELRRRGFLEVTFTREAVTARWHFMDSVTETSYGVEKRELRARV
ncbi:MAG: alkaline phosphatase D family protein [Pseudomonadota bacterium]